MFKKLKDFVYDNKCYFVGGALLAILYASYNQDNVTQTLTSTFIDKIKAGQVTKVVV
jgi:hypothetical protein